MDKFTTQKKGNNKEKRIPNTKSFNDTLIRRNGIQENQIRIFNGIENENIINGINTENNNIGTTENSNNIYNEEINNINDNSNYRRLNTDLFYSKNNTNRNENINRCELLRSNKNISSNPNRDKGNHNYLSNTVEGKNETTKSKKIKNQYPLFFNTHDYSINNENLDCTIKSKTKKTNKLLIKNLSNSKVKIERKKQKDILNYLDASYFNKYNTSANKVNNTKSINEDKLIKRIKPPVPTINNKKRTKERKLISNTNTSYSKNKNNQNNNSSKNQYYNSPKLINNERNEINMNSKQNSNILNFDADDDDNYYDNFFDDKSNDTTNNDLTKLIEKNLNIENLNTNFKTDIDPQKIFAQGIMESFCYFKILDKDSPKFNPLDSCAVNPEALGYCEGYISLDVILGHLKIIPKKTATDNFKNNNFINNNIYNNLYNNFNNNGKNNYLINNDFENNENNICIRIELKDINDIKIKKHMQDILKIHKIFLKYNSHSGMEYEDNNGRIKKRVLSLNKLIYMKEITEINMDQNEKIKAALCNCFAFTLIFGNNKINKVECIFINFEQFNIWNKCLETIAENNKKSKNALISARGVFHRKYSTNYNNKKANGSAAKDNYIYNN